jgi:ATP-dependent DNA helicase RecG
MDYLNSTLIKQYNNKGSMRPEIGRFYNYPYQALEEVVVNALYHRSYENQTPNEIRIYKTGKNRRIEILSYPGPLPPIDNRALQQLNVVARNYRNIRLGEWLKNLRLAEKYATGIPTMIESLRKNESPLLSLTTDEALTYFLAIIRIHPETPIQTSSEYEEIEPIRLSNLQQSILESVRTEPVEENKLKKLFSENIMSDLKILQSLGLIKSKSISKLIFFKTKVFFITEKGNELLKISF